MPARFLYRVCGLSCASSAPIAGLRAVPSDSGCDVTISIRGQGDELRRARPEAASIWYVTPEQEESGAPLLTVWSSPKGYLLQYSEGADYLIDAGGDHVEVQWTSPLTEADAASYLLGPVLAFVLRLRGTVPLHASAVAIEGRGVLFVGEAGAGKSSTAAAFATLGYPILSDDIVAIGHVDDRALAYPSHPRLSVWSDSAEALFGGPEQLPLHSQSYLKSYLDVLDAGYRFQPSPVPIDMIYVLGDRSAVVTTPFSRPVGQRSALLALVRHTYGSYLLDATMREREFHVLGRLVQQVPVRELSLGESLQQLSSECRVLAEGAQRAMVG